MTNPFRTARGLPPMIRMVEDRLMSLRLPGPGVLTAWLAATVPAPLVVYEWTPWAGACPAGPARRRVAAI
ncbi:hypothetical protein ACFYON_03150 [Micromonospora sp. NPDC005686]|uniref:hypothetical protein n=2 Tax=unclassified Micromonospora TaxID=2617518 RepID=UPI0033B18F9A